MNPRINLLKPYPFERIAKLKASAKPTHNGLSHISLSIGEPQHQAPKIVTDALIDNLELLTKYPATKGSDNLRNSIASWTSDRYGADLDPGNQIAPCSGTREGIFALIQALSNGEDGQLIAMPNPFYQIYEGAALLANAKPLYLNCTAQTKFIPSYCEVTPEQWEQVSLLLVCSPGNPTGEIHTLEDYRALFELADKHDFIIAADECYSELYPQQGEAPLGILEACIALGRTNYHRALTIQSLSKRSNLPGLRSGFIAGDSEVIRGLLLYRTYHGCAIPVPAQIASEAAWGDEAHVVDNRQKYDEKYEIFLRELSPVIDIVRPAASFYIWLKTPIDDEEFCLKLFEQQNITVLPGKYLSRTSQGVNPGSDYVRIALVSTTEECLFAAQRIKEFIEKLNENS